MTKNIINKMDIKSVQFLNNFNIMAFISLAIIMCLFIILFIANKLNK